jgi:hypothetical protein
VLKCATSCKKSAGFWTNHNNTGAKRDRVKAASQRVAISAKGPNIPGVRATHKVPVDDGYPVIAKSFIGLYSTIIMIRADSIAMHANTLFDIIQSFLRRFTLDVLNGTFTLEVCMLQMLQYQ